MIITFGATNYNEGMAAAAKRGDEPLVREFKYLGFKYLKTADYNEGMRYATEDGNKKLVDIDAHTVIGGRQIGETEVKNVILDQLSLFNANYIAHGSFWDEITEYLESREGIPDNTEVVQLEMF